jgi:DNA polymerase-1
MSDLHDYGVLIDIDKLGTLCDRLLAAERDVAFDLETGYASSEPDRDRGATDWSWDKQFVVGFSFSGDPSWARYVPLRHDSGGNVEDEAAAWAAIKPLLTKGKVTAHHGKFEERGVRKAGGYVIGSEGGVLEDTMLMAYALGGVFAFDKAIRAAYSLKDLVQIVFGHRMTHIEELFPVKLTERQLKAIRFNVLDLSPAVVSYACEDAAWTLALRQRIRGRAQSERPLMFALEHEISRVMAEVEAYGLGVDWEAMHEAMSQGQSYLPNMESAVKDGLRELGKEYGCVVGDVDLNSSKQMQRLLYHDLHMVTTRQTPTAAKKLEKDPNTPKWQLMSTDAAAMNGLAKKHPVVRSLLSYREALNMMNRLTKWTREVEPYTCDGRAHATYRQAGAEDSSATAPGTGRFSAADPAVQQLPKEWRWSTQLGVDVWDDEAWAAAVAAGSNGQEYWNGHFRTFIVAAPGHYLLTFDFKTIEMRVLAGLSKEPSLLKAFEQGIDVHVATAATMLGKPATDVTEKERQDFGKRLNFALVYQEGPQALADQLGVSMSRAKELLTQYYAAMPKVSSWQDRAVARGIRLGYAETPFERRYQVHELASKDKGIQAKGRRVLVNAPVQGGAADLAKLAMLRISRELKRRGWWREKVMMVMNQHDSLSFECRNDMDPNEVREVLERCATHPVPGYPAIEVEWELGQSWGGAAKWKAGETARWDGKHWGITEDKTPQAVVSPVDERIPVRTVGVTRTQVTGTISAVDSHGSVTIQAFNTPDRESFVRLLQLVASQPGETEVVLRCPAGTLPIGKSCLSMSDSGRVSLILGGAMMTATAGVEDVRALANGLTL